VLVVTSLLRVVRKSGKIGTKITHMSYITLQMEVTDGRRKIKKTGDVVDNTK
jgi:hypothetical protein